MSQGLAPIRDKNKGHRPARFRVRGQASDLALRYNSDGAVGHSLGNVVVPVGGHYEFYYPRILHESTWGFGWDSDGEHRLRPSVTCHENGAADGCAR